MTAKFCSIPVQRCSWTINKGAAILLCLQLTLWWTSTKYQDRIRSLRFIQIREEQKWVPAHVGRHSVGPPDKLKIDLALVSCGNLRFVSTLIKSAILFSQDVQLHFILITDDSTMGSMKLLIDGLLSSIPGNGTRVTYELTLARFPTEQEFYWRYLYKECATQRLFLPTLLPHLDSVISMDTDNMIMGNLSTLWTQLYSMNDGQLLAAAPDTRNSYHPARGFPYVQPSGINSGVLLMNLTRMRQVKFEDQIMDIPKRYSILIYDQDILNIVLHDHPAWFKPLSCSYNFFIGYCSTPEDFCNIEVQNEGVIILHGAAMRFRRKRFRPNSLFFLLYRSMEAMKLREHPNDLMATWKAKLNSVYFICSNVVDSEMVLRNAVQYFENLHAQ